MTNTVRLLVAYSAGIIGLGLLGRRTDRATHNAPQSLVLMDLHE
jgi:hypothetical protein